MTSRLADEDAERHTTVDRRDAAGCHSKKARHAAPGHDARRQPDLRLRRPRSGELDEQTPLQPARTRAVIRQQALPPLAAAGCACLMIAAVAYGSPQNEGGTTLRVSREAPRHPNGLDDAGYDDLWASSDSRRTSTALRDEGVELTSHYVASECTPTRGACSPVSILLPWSTTGRHLADVAGARPIRQDARRRS